MPVLQATRQHTGGLIGERLEIQYNAGRFWPPLANKEAGESLALRQPAKFIME